VTTNSTGPKEQQPHTQPSSEASVADVQSVAVESNNLEKSLPFPCTEPNCNYRFMTQKRLTFHMNKTHGERKKFKCPKCEKEFASAGIVKKHLWVVHDRKEKLPCKFCKKIFIRRDILNKHLWDKHEAEMGSNAPQYNNWSTIGPTQELLAVPQPQNEVEISSGDVSSL